MNIWWHQQIKCFGFFRGRVVQFTLLKLKLILLELKMQHIYYFCNYFMNSPAHVVKSSLIRLVLFHPQHIFAWYKISSNPLLLTIFPLLLKKYMKSCSSYIPEIHNDVLEFIWINPDSFIMFLVNVFCLPHPHQV